jgi:predicted permease
MDAFLQDLRHSFRSLAKSPSFATVATLCLALAIGVNTAAFSLINTLAFRDLPGIERQSQLVDIWLSRTESWGRTQPAGAASPDYAVFRDSTRAFTGIAAVGRALVAVQIRGSTSDALHVPAAIVSENYFTVLGGRPGLGRFFSDPDSRAPGSNPVAVVTDQFWRARLDSNPAVIGAVLNINGQPFTIIGVGQPGFVGHEMQELFDPEQGVPQIWIPLSMAGITRPVGSGDLTRDWDARWLRMLARIREGSTRDEASAEAGELARRTAVLAPEKRRDPRAVLTPLGMPPGGVAEIATAVVLFLSVPALVLLVACANLANLLLARGAARQKEIAVRLSLGATRSRIVRQLLTESMLIALGASALGLVIARWTADIARAFSLALPLDVPLDLRVLAYASLLAFATTIAFGLVPALQATRPDLTEALKEGSAGSGYRRSRLRSTLVVAQIAVSLVMLATSGLFIRTVAVMLDSDTGMERERLLLASVDLDLLHYTAERGTLFRDAALQTVRSLPGVEAVGTATWTPADFPPGEERVSRPQHDEKKGHWARVGAVSGDFFRAAGIPVRGGRVFDAGDRAGARPVVIINEILAEELSPDSDPRALLGQPLRLGTDSSAVIADIVGIVGATYIAIRDDVKSIVYLPADQRYDAGITLYVRTRGDPALHVCAVRSAIRQLDPALPLLDVATSKAVTSQLLSPLKATGNAMGLFGAVGLLLAGLGVYAVMSFVVTQRTHEIGVRMALGARHAAVMGLVLRQAMGLAMIGIVIGLGGATALGMLIASEIHRAPPADPLNFGAVSALLIAIALAATAVPVRRATRVDPMVALRRE